VRPARALGLYAFVFGVATLALLAAVAALALARQGRTEPVAAAPAPAYAPSQVGRPFPTSFGVVSVDQFVTLRRPNGRALIASQPEQEGIQVAVTLTNLGNPPLALSTRMFGVRVDATGSRVAPAISSLPASVSGQSARKALFRFLVPNVGSQLTLVFRDPGRQRPLLIDLGRVDTARVIPLNLDIQLSHRHH
jgi:hypothetical protein